MSQHAKVAEIMTPGPITARPMTWIARAADDMRAAGVQHLPVVDDHGCVIGLLSHLDVVAVISRRGRSHVRVAEAMSEPITVRPNTRVVDAIATLLRTKCHVMPVVGEHEQLLGMVTESDLLRVVYEQMVV